MLFVYEFKKIFLKQKAVIFILIAFLIKLFTSLDLFKVDLTELSAGQLPFYLEYIDRYGGKWNEENYREITALYNEVETAVIFRKEIDKKYSNGEISTEAEYVKALSEVPEIAARYEAIKQLYRRYSLLSASGENCVLLAGDAKGMTTGAEYALMLIICYISAASVFYERKSKSLFKTMPKSRKNRLYNLLTVYIAVFVSWGLIFSFELFSVISTVGLNNMGATVLSLDSFANTPYKTFSILQMFIVIQLLKLCGYLLLSSVTIFLSEKINNFPLCVLSPFFISAVWIYLFGSNNPTYYSPFSLVLGSPYMTGDFYINQNRQPILLYNEVPCFLTILFVFISVFAVLISVISRLNKEKKPIKAIAFIAIIPMILTGCNGATDDNNIYSYEKSNTYTDGEYHYALTDIYGDDGSVIKRTIEVYNKNNELVFENIDRDILQNSFIIEIQLFDNFIYCKKEISDGEKFKTVITRISTESFHEEIIYEHNSTDVKSMYLDLLTVWTDDEDRSRDISYWIITENGLYIFTDNNKAYLVKNGISEYLFEDMRITDPIIKGNSIYYLNIKGNPVCRKNGKEYIISNRSFFGMTAKDDGIYCYNESAEFKYSYDEFSEKEINQNQSLFA